MMYKLGKLVGKGAFSKVYEYGEDQVLIHSNDMQKACYAEQDLDCDYLPKLEKIYNDDHLPYKDGYSWYISPRYNKVRAFTKELKSNDLELYRTLKGVFDSGAREYEGLRKVFAELNLGYLCDIVDSLCNYISTNNLRFEISPRNIALDNNGDLVLLDCFFCYRTLRQNQK